MSNFVFMNRSRILATTARRQTIGAMNAMKPLSSWSAIAAGTGASGNGGNGTGASTSAANTVGMRMAAATIVTAIDALEAFVEENGNGAPKLEAPRSCFATGKKIQREFTSSSS